jgi:hypothetical protein
MTTKLGSQNERVRARVEKFGFISRNECLRQVPAITRLASRIKDLEKKGLKFRAEEVGNDYFYHLVSINGKSCIKPDDLAHAAQLCKDFDEGRL